MATVQSSTSSSVYDAINAASGGTGTSKTQEAQDRFLKLLVTQLKNQDPLNPMDNAEMTSQLAQMSTVEGIDKLNTTLNGLVDDLGTSQSMQAASLIGKNVMVTGNQLAFADGVGYAGINLASAADEVTVKILDANGAVVQTQSLGEQEAGVVNFAWDGKTSAGTTAAAGNYKFSVQATQGGKAVTVDPLQIGTVYAMVRTSSGFQLDLGTLGNADFKNVQQIL